MKKFKQILALLLVLIMTMAVGITTVSAADTKGSITVDNAVVGQTYTIYKLLDLQVEYPDNPRAYVYTAPDSEWLNFFNGLTYDSGAGTSASCYTVTELGGKNVVALADDVDEDDKDIVARTTADKAVELINAKAETDNPIASIDSIEATSTTVQFTDLDLGYYLVVSNRGVLAALNTAAPDATVKEKNSLPTNDKVIVKGKDSENKDITAKNNVAQIGDVVNFKSTITAAEGNTTSYRFHDKMDAGLTLNPDSIEIYKNGVKIADDKIQLLSDGSTSKDENRDCYIFTGNSTDDADCTFEVEIKDNYLTPGDTLEIRYNATVNNDFESVLVPIKNTSYLTYGNNQTTTDSTTKTFLGRIGIHKFYKPDADTETMLPGAEFILYKIENDTTYYAKMNSEHRLVGWDTTEANATKMVTSETGGTGIWGIKEGTYYIRETKAPEGFNPLANDILVEVTTNIEDIENDPAATADDFEEYLQYKENKEGAEFISASDTNLGEYYLTVRVENFTGTRLPETGGVGTFLFILLGSIAVIGTGLFLVVNKRMKKEDL